MEMATTATTATEVSTLYVADLHPDVTDARLYELFCTIGAVTSVRICRDTVSGRSLGYCYVNMSEQEDAINAIEKLNHTVLCGKPIRIMRSHKDPGTRNSGIGNVFVKNLSESVDNMKLQEMFGKFGTILSGKVATEDGKSKGYGFVQFDSQDSANAAIENLNGTTVDGKQIYVGNFIKKCERIPNNPEANFTNLYIKNLDQDITEELIELKFSEFGKIVNVKIEKDEAGNSKGFGFVNFENHEDAKKAMEAMNGLKLGSKTLYVARAQKKEERLQNLMLMFEDKCSEQIKMKMASNLYVKNIDDSVDDNALLEHFSKYGTVTSAKVMLDEKGSSKGFGFVCYATPEEATKALDTLHGCMFHGKPLYVAIAQRKEERKEQLRLQRAQSMTSLDGSTAAVIPTDYPRLYYSSPEIMPQILPRQGLVYQPFEPRPGWQPSGFDPPSKPTFQMMSLPVIPNSPRQQRQNKGQMYEHFLPQSGHSMPPYMFQLQQPNYSLNSLTKTNDQQIPNSLRQQRQNRGRMYEHFLPQSGQSMPPYMPQLQQPNYSLNSLTETNDQQRYARTRHQQNGKQGEINNVSLAVSASSNQQEMEMLSSRLAAVSLREQKQMLGERLLPLVQKLEADLAAKITGMLLEMDNSELLLLLESPESLAAKVEEAIQVLMHSFPM